MSLFSEVNYLKNFRTEIFCALYLIIIIYIFFYSSIVIYLQWLHKSLAIKKSLTTIYAKHEIQWITVVYKTRPLFALVITLSFLETVKLHCLSFWLSYLTKRQYSINTCLNQKQYTEKYKSLNYYSTKQNHSLE